MVVQLDSLCPAFVYNGNYVNESLYFYSGLLEGEIVISAYLTDLMG